MFRIKICGITNTEDALAAARAGTDAVGLNFYEKSPRCVDLDRAREIVKALPASIVKVGVFVNAPVAEICRVFDQLGLDVIQLHGDEPPEFLVDLCNRRVIRAFRPGPDGLEPVEDYLAQCRSLDLTPRMVLLDSRVEGKYGGSGELAKWSLAKEYTREITHPPLVLAGGLTQENVAEAIRVVHPAAVDTASGVESSPGKKDPAAVEAFVRAARQAFGEPRL